MTKRQSKSQPTWTDVKAKLADFDRAALLGLIQSLYTAHKDNQTFLHAHFGLGEDVLEPYKKTIDRWLWPDLFRKQDTSVSQAKRATAAESAAQHGRGLGSRGPRGGRRPPGRNRAVSREGATAFERTRLVGGLGCRRRLRRRPPPRREGPPEASRRRTQGGARGRRLVARRQRVCRAARRVRPRAVLRSRRHPRSGFAPGPVARPHRGRDSRPRAAHAALAWRPAADGLDRK